METVAVISASGKKLMPTNSYRARKLLKKGRAVIHKVKFQESDPKRVTFLTTLTTLLHFLCRNY